MALGSRASPTLDEKEELVMLQNSVSRREDMSVPNNEIHYLEIVASEPEATRDFYGQAFGWEFEDAAPELGNAFVATLPNGSLYGIRGTLSEQEQPVVRTYVRVPDIEAATKKATELGATLMLGAIELPGRGKIAIYSIGGVEQGVWQVD